MAAHSAAARAGASLAPSATKARSKLTITVSTASNAYPVAAVQMFALQLFSALRRVQRTPIARESHAAHSAIVLAMQAFALKA